MIDIAFLSVDEARGVAVDWPDVYFTPGYGHACEASDGAAWEVAVADGGALVFPYLRRPVDAELTAGEALFDVVSPYGYAGTFAAPGVGQERVRAFRSGVRAALAERGGLAEFHRCSGLVPGVGVVAAADRLLEVERLHDTVAVDLTRGYDACWAAAEGRSRTKTRKARKKGYIVEHREATLADVLPGGAFRDLYDGTMRRVEARPYYLFPDAYYARLVAELPHGLGMVLVRDGDGAVGCAGVYFTHPPLLHLHLVGSLRQAQRDGAGNLLYDAMIQYGCAHGFETLHLGGGFAAGDRLFYFKQSFGGHPVPFHVARGVLAPARYAVVVERRARQTDRTVEDLRATGYFPAYRG